MQPLHLLRMVWRAWSAKPFMNKIWLRSLAFFKPGFHPWQHDNLALIQLWCDEYERSKDPLQATALLLQWQQQHLKDYLKAGYGSSIPQHAASVTNMREPA